MIWYLIFCSSISGGPTCTTTAMPSREACLFVGKEMKETAALTNNFHNSKYKCVGVKKESM
jgi:hypothetical protein